MKNLILVLFIIVLATACITLPKNTHHSSNEDLKEQSYLALEFDNTICNLKIENDTAYYYTGDYLIYNTYLQPKKMIGGEIDNPQEIQDTAYLIANCLVVLRNIKTAGYFCHIPQIENVEVYTFRGLVLSYKQDDLKSKCLDGFDFVDNFNGRFYSSPINNWGIINIDAEGEIYGYLFVKNDGSIKEIQYKNSFQYGDNATESHFNKNNEFIISARDGKNKLGEIIINSDGEYRFVATNN